MASVFSGKAGRNAAIWTADKAAQGLDEIKDIYNTAQTQAGGVLGDTYQRGGDYLKSAFTGSAKSLNQGGAQAGQFLQQGVTDALGQSNAGYGQARNDINGAAGVASGQIGAGYAQGIQQLQQMYGQATGAQQQAVDAYNPLVANGMAGYNMLNNSLGLNGAEGNAAAQNAFQAGPGYQWNVDQATSQAARQANKMGGSALGGNATDQITRLASNLANQEYGGWQDRLQTYQGAATAAVGGQAAQLQGLADMYQNQGRDVSTLQVGQGKDLAGITTHAGDANAQLAQNNGQFNAGIAQTGAQGQAANASKIGEQLAALRSQYGLNQANLTTQYGGAQAGLITGTAGAIADATNNAMNTTVQAGQQGMMAGQQAAANKMGAIMGGLQLGASVLGAGMGSGGMLTNLFGGMK